MTKERPILFSAPMVRALLAGTKTQTRRVLKLRPGFDFEERDDGRLWPWAEHPDHEADVWMPCPYGQPGDRHWVRETFFAWGRWETRYSAKKGRDEWHFLDMTEGSGRKYLYAADNANYAANLGANQGRGVYPGWWKRPAIFMPRAASRILLEVTDVRVERLQSISREDAQAEGLKQTATGSWLPGPCDHPEWAYHQLWDQINGEGTWDTNPWVWAITFRRVEGREP